MSQEDRARWDEKWAGAGPQYAPHPLLVNHAGYLSGGLALDLACGRGQNALWLAGIGYHVLGVDISGVALEAARDQALRQGLLGQVAFAVVDLDEWTPPRAAFDLVIVFRFLDRRLFSPIRDALRAGGLVCYSTRHRGLLSRDPQANRRYLLREGELAATFRDWKLLYQHEGPVDAQLIARKPGHGR